jgi:magnesium chelatase subunit D
MTETEAGARTWTSALQALTLFAADPAGLGGIAIRAGAGPVRDRFLALLRSALPPAMPLRRVPAAIAEDRLLGGLDLAATLQSGHPVEQQGLLAEADGGVLILAMAERLESGTAAHLRAALDTGAVHVQRDGVSSVRQARFGVIALDEGAAADETVMTSLLDRMAFLVDLTAVSIGDCGLVPILPNPSWPGPSGPPVYTPGSEEVGRTSRAMTRKAAFPMTGEPAFPQIKAGSDTHAGVSAVPTDLDEPAEALTAAALALGIVSLRAPLFALRAAIIAAHLDDRDQIDSDDLSLAAALILAPRATVVPRSEETTPEPEPEPPPPPEPSDDPSPPDTIPDQPLEDIVLEAALAALPPNLLAQLTQDAAGRGAVRTPGRAGQTRLSVTRGRPIGARRGEPRNGARLNLLETLKAAAPWQTLRSRDTARFEVRRDDFRIRRFRQRIGATTIFVVDASGSAAMQRLGEAKGAVEYLLADCYVRRDQVALLAFRGVGAQMLLPPTGSLVRAKRCLAGLPGGGPTPLAAGIDAAAVLADSIRRTGRTPVIALLTDAKANIARDGSPGRPRAEADAVESARTLRLAGIATLMIDTSPRPNAFARRLAEEMHARYLPLPYADPAALSRAVRAETA